MENIFNGVNTKQKGEFVLVRVHRDTAKRLQDLKKGSSNKAILWLLSKDNPDNLKEQVKLLNDEIEKVKEQVQRLVLVNKLRI